VNAGIAMTKLKDRQPQNPLRDEDCGETLVFRASAALDEVAIRKILCEANLAFQSSNESGSSGSPAFGVTSIYLCESAGRIVAVLQWRHLGEEVEILDVAVSAAHRRMGYGRSLLRDFLRVARERGTREVFLEVRESNAAALSLYRELGFEQTAHRPNYYRDPVEAALLLHLKLTD
jgi:ribosomal-protein-alanine acetyltransferase